MSLDISLIIAIYGAILSTLAAILSFRTTINEHKKNLRAIKVILEYISNYDQYRVRIVNSGFRRITVVSIGGTIYNNVNGKLELYDEVPANVFLDNEEHLPFAIDDGDCKLVYLQKRLSEYYSNKMKKLLVYVYDAEGKKYDQSKEITINPKYEA